jgi:hypothetical protein
VRGREGELLHFGEVVLGVSVQRHAADLSQRVLALGPDLSRGKTRTSTITINVVEKRFTKDANGVVIR